MSKKINPANSPKNEKIAKKPTSANKAEIKIYGENACLAVFKKRPHDIIQVFLTKELMSNSKKPFSQITKYCAQNKKAYHLVARSELESMTKATHHEDVCMLIKKSTGRTLEQYLSTKPENSLLVALDNVSNPHNIGAILRSAAHFGVDGLIIPDKKLAEAAASIRTSEGGFEFVEIFEASDFKKTISLLQKNKYQVITTSSHAEKSLYDLKWEKRNVILFGEEAHGLGQDTIQLGTLIKIPGTDSVESLNVSVACAIVVADYYQRVKQHEKAPRFK